MNSTNSKPTFIGVIVTLIISLIFPIIALSWILKLEKIQCKCSENWERDYLKKYLYFVVGWVIFSALIAIITEMSIGKFIISTFGMFIGGFVGFILLVIGIAYVIISLDYITKLKDKKCECSEDIRREITYVLNIISVVLYGLLFFIMIISVIFGFALTGLSKNIQSITPKNIQKSLAKSLTKSISKSIKK